MAAVSGLRVANGMEVHARTHDHWRFLSQDPVPLCQSTATVVQYSSLLPQKTNSGRQANEGETGKDYNTVQYSCVLHCTVLYLSSKALLEMARKTAVSTVCRTRDASIEGTIPYRTPLGTFCRSYFLQNIPGAFHTPPRVDAAGLPPLIPIHHEHLSHKPPLERQIGTDYESNSLYLLCK